MYIQPTVKSITLLEFPDGTKMEVEGNLSSFHLNVDNNLELTEDVSGFYHPIYHPREASFSFSLRMSEDEANRLRVMLLPKPKWYKRLINYVRKFLRKFKTAFTTSRR
jgi:hypothetical protein